MPEGHTVHRIANQFRELFLNQPVNVSSPQGRFSASAAQISGQKLIRSYAVGKQMFLEFENDLFLRVHLGIYGKWKFHDISKTKQVPQIIGEVRARFSAGDWVVDLRGPTVCEVVDDEAIRVVLNRLGPDPLNPNPKARESERFISRVLASKVEIGKLLMNQDVISGIGNVYRCEILFRHEIEPHTPGNALTREQLQSIWDDCVKLLRVGVRTGFMITRDELFNKRTTKESRNFIYKREGQPCHRCGVEVKIEIMATRKLYWCPGCQR